MTAVVIGVDARYFSVGERDGDGVASFFHAVAAHGRGMALFPDVGTERFPVGETNKSV